MLEAGFEVVGGVRGRVAVINESNIEGPGDVAVLSVGPDAHEEFDVVETPRAALEVAVGAVEGRRVSSRHADVSFVVFVEVCPDSQDVVGAARMTRELQANVRK